MHEGTIVLVGAASDEHIAAIRNRLGALGQPSFVLDLLRFPAQLRVSLGERSRAVIINGEPVQPAAVYVRDLGVNPLRARVGRQGGGEVDPYNEQMQRHWRRTLTAIRERDDVIDALALRWERDEVPLYNGPTAFTNTNKPLQLAVLERAGLPVPETLWTNDPAAVRAFAKGRPIIYKPVAGGALTKELSPDDLDDRRLALLAAAPVTFQALLPGEDVRVYVLDDEVVAAVRIETTAIDFRGSEQAIVPIDLPKAVREQCRKAARLLGLRFTGIDLKRDGQGVLRLLECNSSPMFLGFDAAANTDIAGSLAERLARWARARTRPSL